MGGRVHRPLMIARPTGRRPKYTGGLRWARAGKLAACSFLVRHPWRPRELTDRGFKRRSGCSCLPRTDHTDARLRSPRTRWCGSGTVHAMPCSAGALRWDSVTNFMLSSPSVRLPELGLRFSASGGPGRATADQRPEETRGATDSSGGSSLEPPRGSQATPPPPGTAADEGAPDELPPPLDIPALQRAAAQAHGREASPPTRGPHARERAQRERRRRREPVAAGLRVICANVQRSRPNTTLLLEQNADADIICLQEPCWTYVKQVASTTNGEGDEYHNTAHHRGFITLGAREDSRVVVFVNRARWAHTSPRVRVDCINHADVLCVTMNFDDRELTFINVYNDSRTFAAVRALLDRAEHLPPVTFMCGDFNLRHPMWDRGERPLDAPGRRHQLRHRRECEDLISLATDHLALELGNAPDGPPTWYSNNLGVREGVLDLLWIDPALRDKAHLRIRDLDRNDSDHAPLEWRLDIATRAQSVPQVRRGSEEGGAFVKACRAAVRALGDRRPHRDAYTSREEVEDTARHLEGAFRCAWDAHATVGEPTKRSKSWWDRRCGAAARSLRKARVLRKGARQRRSAALRRVKSVPTDLCPLEWVQEVHRCTREVHRVDAVIRKASKQLKGAARRARQKFFDRVMKRAHPSRIWDFVEWTKPRRNDVTTGIVDQQGVPADSQEALGRTFQEQFTPANARPVDMTLLDEIPQLPERLFPAFSPAELHDAIAATSNFSAPGPDHISWFWLKRIVRDESGEEFEEDEASDHLDTERPILAFFDACVRFAVHPKYFKASFTVVIPKPGKPDYTRAKAYRPIVLLNCLGKLLEKLIAKRMQFDAQKFGIMHPCQFGGTAQHSTTDAGIQLVHNIRQAWKMGMDSSALLLDVSQFFPSIHHGLLAGILRKQGFDAHLCAYFEHYLVDRQTQFRFNGATLAPMDFSTGVGQGSSLSPVLTGLYLAPLLHRVAATEQVMRLSIAGETHTLRQPWTPKQMAANGHASVQFFVDDGLIHVAGKLGPGAEPEDQLKYNCVLLRQVFERVHGYLTRAGLGIEHDKLELMHFTRRRAGAANGPWSDGQPLGPSLKIRASGGPILVRPASTMRYLGFYLDPRLTFKEHVRFYATKACSTVTAMRMLGNSVRGMSPVDRRRLYISNVLPLVTYGAQLWWHPQWKGIKAFLDPLQKAQSRAARWITGAFRTTPIGSMEAAAGLLPMRQQINKYMTRACLRVRTLHPGHPTHALLPAAWPVNKHNISAPFPLTGRKTRDAVTPATHVNDLAGSLCQEDFAATHDECRPGYRVRDAFYERIVYFMSAPSKASDGFKPWLRNFFTPILEHNLATPSARVLFTDGSRMASGDDAGASGPTTGAGFSVHYHHNGRRQSRSGSFGCGEVTAFDAEMFALARGLAEACRDAPADMDELHVYTDNRAALLRILNPAVGPSQMCAVTACRTVRSFLEASPSRAVYLHWCPAHVGVELNERVDDLAKTGTQCSQPEFTSLAMAKQTLTAGLYSEWQARLAERRYVGRHALLPALGAIKHTRKNWHLAAMGQHPRELARFVRFSSNHFPCGEYRERFNLSGPTRCWQCRDTVESRDHIMYECPAWSRLYGVNDKAARARHEWEQWAHWRRSLPPDRVVNTWDPGDRREALSMSVDELRCFLRANPVVGTFAWAEIVEEAVRDEDAGLTEETSLAIARAQAHSVGRRDARVRWIRDRERTFRAAGKPLEKTSDLEACFTDWYARSTAARLCDRFACPARRADLLREFGAVGAHAPDRAGDGAGPGVAVAGRREADAPMV